VREEKSWQAARIRFAHVHARAAMMSDQRTITVTSPISSLIILPPLVQINSLLFSADLGNHFKTVGVSVSM